ncbi:Sec-independent protein translocase protein TatA [Candidatus Promineifilum breve]|uniref:Sec-independent protein translocase protein TatA n=1 Tax=Candidatus Promineifilum breve TaxID=1806508 RepID=A0A160SXU6_9CHLR|nr:twin-arginine translocase TatA/TatE family subunit [Candidatus Promineifilum breve]CUS02181.2 Sec-independent protein translocase protein TatA [Candidatus Promineifilum breve]
MGSIGWPELLIVLAVVLLIFGVGRIARVGGELGKGVSAFREGLKDEKQTTAEKEAAEKQNDLTGGPTL